METWLEKKAKEMYSTHNEERSVVAERFIRTLKNKIDKYKTSISSNVYIDKLDNMVNKYKNTYHSTIKMKPVGLKSGTYIDFDKKNNKEDPNFKVHNHVRISKYKNIFAKGYVPNWSEEVFVIKKVKKFEDSFFWRGINCPSTSPSPPPFLPLLHISRRTNLILI